MFLKVGEAGQHECILLRQPLFLRVKNNGSVVTGLWLDHHLIYQGYCASAAFLDVPEMEVMPMPLLSNENGVR
jgi:hypothetical protein